MSSQSEEEEIQNEKETTPSISIETSPPQSKTTLRKRKNSPLSENDETKPTCKKGRKKQLPESESSSVQPQASLSPDSSTPPPVPDILNAHAAPGGLIKPYNKKRKVEPAVSSSGPASNGPKLTRKEQQVQDFMLDVLPALKRDMKHKKTQESSFKIRDHSNYFTPSSKFTPTFLLPLFNFLGKEEIVCSRYGNFDGKHLVKTTAGFQHATFLITNCDLSEDENNYLISKFGKEWFKIPSKDAVKASSANKYGDKGEFKITLIGLYEDSFLDAKQNEVFTVNPILRYDTVKAPKEKK